MPFLGNTPANTFVSIAKQTITGNGGTSYSLSYPVTNANEIDVFFNNVRQEPTVAYSASGTTITFTEAIASTDSVYVIFNGQAVGTIDAPVGAYLPTTGGTINGNVGIKVNANSGTPLIIGRVNTDAEGAQIDLCRSTDNTSAWAIDVYGSTSTPSLRIIDNTAGATRLSIDGSGRVTKPSQVGFAAWYNGSTYSSTPIFDTVAYNTGNAYNSSTGVFTAPVSGVYQISGWYRFNQTGATYCQFGIKRNGSNSGWAGSYVNSTTANSTYATPIISISYYLNAGDYISPWAAASGGSPTVSGAESWFSCYLLG